MTEDSIGRPWARPRSWGASRSEDAAVVLEPELTRSEVAGSSLRSHLRSWSPASDSRRGRAVRAGWPFLFLLAFQIVVYGVPGLAGYPVWSDHERGTPSILKLPLTVDTTTFATLDRPVRAWLRTSLNRGDLPLWLETQALGVPLIEQYEYELFYPLAWLKWPGGDGWWTSVLCLELATAGFGLYLAARSMLGVSAPAALAGAIVFTGIGYPSWFYMLVGLVTPIVQLPYVLLLLYRLAHGHTSIRLVAGLAVSVALILLTGQPQIILCIALGLGALFLLELVAVRKSAVDLGRRLAAAATAGVVACLIAAPQIVPFVQDQVWGGAYSNHPFDITGSRSATPPINLLNPVSPFLQGPIVPLIDDSSIVPVSTDDFGLSFGAAGAFLILVGGWAGLRAGGVARRLALILGCSLGGIVWMSLVDPRIWPFAMVNVTRYSPLVLGLFGGMLAAYGAERLATIRSRVGWLALAGVLAVPVAGVLYLVVKLQPERIRDTWLLTHAAVLTVAPLVALIVVLVATVWRRHERVAVASLLLVVGECLFAMRYGLPLEIEWTRLAPLGLFTLAAILMLLGRVRMGAGAGLVATGLIMAHWTYLSPQLASSRWSIVSSPSVPAITGWRDTSDGPARILAHSGWLHPDLNAPLGIQSLANRNPITSVTLVGYLYEFWRPTVLQKSQRSIGMIQMEGASVRHQVQPDGTVALPDNALDWSEYFAARPFFNLIGLNLLVDDTNGPLHVVLGKSDATDLALVHRDDCSPADRSAHGGYCIEVFEDRRALPRAYLAPSYAVVPKTRDGWGARRWLSENRDVMLQKPVAELDDAHTRKFDGVSYFPSSIRPPDSAPLLPAKIVTYTPNEVVVQVNPPGPSLVVLNDAHHPGWKALVNRTARPVMRVNSVVRGVLVDRGEREVRFVFENGLSRNVAISLGTLLLLTLCVFVLPHLPYRRSAARSE